MKKRNMQSKGIVLKYILHTVNNSRQFYRIKIGNTETTSEQMFKTIVARYSLHLFSTI